LCARSVQSAHENVGISNICVFSLKITSVAVLTDNLRGD
jgi:hypothetical protein